MVNFKMSVKAAVALLIVGASLSSCAKKVVEESTDPVETTEIVGDWEIENIVIDDTTYVRPSEITPDVTQSISFGSDSLFSASTNCNIVGGQYILNGDSIVFSNFMSTRMACENEDVERSLMQVLPQINTIDVLNDTVLRLNSSSEAYILLKK